MKIAERWTPRAYQKVAVKWLVKYPEAALLLDPGLGKTSVTLAAFQALRKVKGAKKLLIVAPMRVCYLVWSHDEGAELSKWSDFKDLRVSLLHGPKKDDAIEVDADVYVINPDGLEWLINSGGLNSLFKRGVDTLAIDELSAFKHSSTKRFKRLKPFLGKFRRRWGLTGTPASNGLIDLFGQIYVLDLGKRLGKYITHYRHTYFVPSGYGGYTWKPQQGGEKRIYSALKDIALSMRVTDHLDLPDMVEQNLWVNIPPKVRKLYDELEDDLISILEDDTVTAANQAVARGKCRQVASGGLYVEDRVDDEQGTLVKRLTKHLHDAKTEALVELIDELQGSPLLVAFEFHHDLERIRKALGDVPAISGGLSPKKTAEIANAWNRGEIPVLCGHPAAMGHGLNLQACGHNVCWYSPTWNFELYDQLNRRVWRQGQKHRVMIHRILARRTVDEDIVAMIANKKRGQDALLDALKQRRGLRHKQARVPIG